VTNYFTTFTLPDAGFRGVEEYIPS